MIKDNSQAFIDKWNSNKLLVPEFKKKKKTLIKLLSLKSKSKEFWTSNNNNQHYFHRKMLQNKTPFQGSLCFRPEEAEGEFASHRLVHDFQDAKKR